MPRPDDAQPILDAVPIPDAVTIDPAGPGGRGRRVRLYHHLRSAHLERAAQLPSATILYGAKSYDFDETLATDLDLVAARGWRAAWFLFRSPVSALEVNEPLMSAGLRSTSLALVGLALRHALGAPRCRVVTYAIENLDPQASRPIGVKRRLVCHLDGALSHYVWRRLDRVAYGTEAAAELYSATFSDSGGRQKPH